MKYPVLDQESAVNDFNKKFMDFQEIQSRIRPPMMPVAPTTEPKMGLGDYLMQNGYPNTYAAKLSAAKSLGMQGYIGTPEQDNGVMMAMQARSQRDTENKKVQNESKLKDREFGLKEKELGIKEKEVAQMKAPSSDEIASSLLKTVNNS